MVSLGFLALSVMLAVATSLGLSEVSGRLAPWNIRVSIGLLAFVFLEFVIFTPIRMWRNSVWVQNVEEALERLWDLHDEGVQLMNAHVAFQESTPDWKDKDKQNEWYLAWRRKEADWRIRMDNALKAFAPAEARRHRNVVTVTMQIAGINELHTHHMNILRVRLERIATTLERYHPSVLPE